MILGRSPHLSVALPMEEQRTPTPSKEEPMTATLAPSPEPLGTRETLATWQALTGSCGPAVALALYEAQFAAFAAGFATVRTGRRYATGWGGELTAVAVGYGAVSVDEVLAGTADAREVTLTADGRQADLTGWHDGEPGGVEHWVYVERWADGRRTFHGYIDADSRRIVQTG